jgi:predicted RNA binding protein YcfA (HicA-like mRNA interferase family)
VATNERDLLAALDASFAAMSDLDVPSRDEWDDQPSGTVRNVRGMSAAARHDAVMAKARQVRAALEKAGWTFVGMVGSHRKFRMGGRTKIFAYHDNVDLGGPALAKIAKDFALTLDELRRLI